MKEFKGFKRGVNLGGWLSQGPYDDEHLTTFITEENIAEIASWGLDHIRVPVDYPVFEYEDGTVRQLGLDLIDQCIEWCKKYNLNMILDLHKTVGYIFDEAEACKGFFYDEQLQERLMIIWDRFAKRYGRYSDMLAFEILNEIVDPAVAEIWNGIAERAIKVIRESAPDTYILVGGTRNNSIVSICELAAPYDDKIVFNFHCYEPLCFTHQGAYWFDNMDPNYRLAYPLTIGEYHDEAKKVVGGIYSDLFSADDEKMICDKEFFKVYFKQGIDICDKYNIPLYCGEYGVIDLADPDMTLLWLKDINAAFEDLGIGRALWNYKWKDFGITDEHYKPVKDEMVKYL